MLHTKKVAALCLFLAACGQPNKVEHIKKAPNSQAASAAATTSAPMSQDTKKDYAKEGRDFIERLSRGEFAAASTSFSPEVKAMVSVEKLAQVWGGLVAQGGAYQKAETTRVEAKNGLQVAIVKTNFEQATAEFSVAFDAKGLISGFRVFSFEMAEVPYVAPSYVKADTFEEREVTVGAGEWALPGTLTLPKGAAPFAAVVLVHGSGAHNRDETIGPQRPFKDLAWGLASQGIAVLRYDKRNKVHGAKMSLKDTINQETVEDALLAAALLRKEPSLDPKKIFVLGHSLGGFVMPRIGAQDKDLAGLISLSGNTRPLEELLAEQFQYIAGLDGSISPEEQTALDAVKASIEKIKDPGLSADADPKTLPLGIPAPYWLDLRGYQPAELAKTLSQPLYIVQGERDYQVTMVDFEGWKTALAGKANASFKSYPTLNHTYMEGEGKATPAEYSKEGHIPEEVIKDLAAWIKSIQ